MVASGPFLWWGWDGQVTRFYNSCKNIPITSREDQWIWLPEDWFSIKSAISVKTTPRPNLDWFMVVWSRYHLPRFAFIIWVTFWKRLPTLVKLSQWGIASSDLCLLCQSQPETQDHLFFQCPFSKSVWKSTLIKLSCKTLVTSWDSISDWLLNTHWYSKFQKDLLTVGLSVVVYHIWRERNQRSHLSQRKNERTITGEVPQSIRLTAISWRKIKKTQLNWEIALNLGLPSFIFRMISHLHTQNVPYEVQA